MPIFQLWDAEAGTSQGVFMAANVRDAVAHAQLDADEEGRIGFAEDDIEVRELSAFPFDEHDHEECAPLIVRTFKLA